MRGLLRLLLIVLVLGLVPLRGQTALQYDAPVTKGTVTAQVMVFSPEFFRAIGAPTVRPDANYGQVWIRTSDSEVTFMRLTIRDNGSGLTQTAVVEIPALKQPGWQACAIFWTKSTITLLSVEEHKSAGRTDFAEPTSPWIKSRFDDATTDIDFACERVQPAGNAVPPPEGLSLRLV